MLCKCSGKYIDIYFILKITFFFLGGGIGLALKGLDNTLGKHGVPVKFINIIKET